ncbi:MAG: hypothetical protein ACI96M_000738 [Candidatus Azotimanducaceae bacterium]|jgi:hypothetical protein
MKPPRTVRWFGLFEQALGIFLSGFPPWLRRHRLGHWLVKLGLIGGSTIKR